MALIQYGQPWAEQPPEPAGIDWSHPLAAAAPLVFAINFAEGINPANRARDVRGGASTSGTLTYGVGQLGAGPIGSNGRLDITDPTDGLRILSGPVTHAGIVHLTAIDSSFGGVFSVADASGNSAFALQRDSTSANLRMYRGNSQGQIASGSPITTLLAGPAVFVACSRGATASVDGGYLYINGVEFSVAPPGGSAGTQAGAGVRFRAFVERAGNTSFGSDGQYFEHYAWAGELPADLARWASQNPANLRQIWEPRRIWVPVSAAGGPASVADTTSAAEFLSIFVGATLSEQATADMAFGGAAGAAVADAAAGTDAAAVLVQLTALDNASGVETTIASCAAGLADAAQGVDAIALFAATLVQLLDAADSTDAVLSGVQAAVADTALAFDQPGAAVLAALLDAGLAADQLQLQVHVALAELGGGGDAVAVLQEALRTVADAVAATDGVTAAVELQLTDTGAAAELLALAAQLQLLEQTVGLDIAVQLSPTTPRKVRLVFRQAHRRMLFSLRQRQAVFRPS